MRRLTNIYAIIETGGKQYRVTQGQTLDVDNLNVIEGDAIELNKVLVIGNDKDVTIGAPTVVGAKVTATSKGTVRGDKIIVYKFKSKVRYRKKTGHHQLFTRLAIDKIEAPDIVQKEPVKTGPAVTFTGILLSSIAVTPASMANLAVGSTQQFTAIGTYPSGSTADITSQVIWASSDPTIVTISPSGLATCVGVGSTNITAIMSGVTSSAVILTVVAPTSTTASS